METNTFDGRGRTSIWQSFDIFLSLGWIPPIENVFIIVLFLLLYSFRSRSRSLSWLCLDYREVHRVDSAGRAFSNALLAKLTLSVVNVGNVVLDSDGLERTNLCTLAATDAGSLASLTCNSTFVLVYARNINAHVSATLVAKLDDRLRTCLYAGAASRTFFFIHNRKSGGRIHFDCAELAGCNAVATSETSERTSGVTAVKSGFHTA